MYKTKKMKMKIKSPITFLTSLYISFLSLFHACDQNSAHDGYIVFNVLYTASPFSWQLMIFDNVICNDCIIFHYTNIL